MSGTFSQIYIQTVFAVKRRENLLDREWRQNVFKYISTIIKEQGQKPIIVNGVGDHVHAFFGLKPNMCVSDLMRHVKANASNFISREYYPKGKFEWQEGYGAFSYSHSQLDAVFKYILNQEEHHQKKTFREEYLNFLEKFNVAVDERNLFEYFD